MNRTPPRSKSLIVLLTCLIIFVVTACFDSNDEEEYLAVVGTFNIPDSVEFGNFIHIKLFSTGFSGCWEKSYDKVLRISEGYLIIPYDKISNTYDVCTDALTSIEHEIFIRPQKLGVSEIHVQYRPFISENGESQKTFTKEVIVY